jgi:chitinase
MGSSVFTYVLSLLFALSFALPISAAAIPAVKRYGTDGRPSGKVVGYFGQGSGVSNMTLSELCSDPSIDVVVIGFVDTIKGKHDLPGVNFSGYCWKPIPGTDLHSCPMLGEAIKKCQKNGKEVLMSIGGSISHTEPFTCDEDAVLFADSIWKLFAEGTGLESFRPFGNATVDGFDLGISALSTPLLSHKSFPWEKEKFPRLTEARQRSRHPLLLPQSH